MTSAARPQNPDKFRRYRERMRASGLRQMRRWVFDAEAPGFQAELERQIARINAAAGTDDVPGLLDAAFEELDRAAGARETARPA